MKHEKISMMDFLGKKAEQNKNKVGTPTKKIKLNEDNDSVDSEWENRFGNLLFIKNISKTQSSMLTQRKPEGAFQISQFSLGFNPEFDHKQNDPLEANKHKKSQKMEQQKQLKLPSKLNKRTNSVQKCPNQRYDSLLTELSLSRHNSTFPAIDLTGLENDDDLGENIYLNQLLTLKAKISLTDANNENREILRNIRNQTKHEENRLEQDFQIKETLGKYQPNKEGFICLNKLEKIFYYVKKTSLSKSHISLSQNMIPISSQSPIPPMNCQYSLQKFISNLSNSKRQTLPQTALICQQIKLYNRDSDTQLVRFYQEWIQNNSLFMIYELGSYSLADKIEMGQKLPESEVWSVIYNCASSLKWIHSCEKLHMNIKPGNIIKCRGKYKLADPLIEHEFVQNHLEHMTTLNQQFYIAPELKEFQSFLSGIEFGKCQVYALGMTLLQNVTAMPRSMKSYSHCELKAYFKKQLHGYSSFLGRLLLRMIDMNHKKRPTFDELLCSNIEDPILKDKVANRIKFKRSNSC